MAAEDQRLHGAQRRIVPGRHGERQEGEQDHRPHDGGRADQQAPGQPLPSCGFLGRKAVRVARRARFAAARTRRVLGDLDDRILADIGLERTDINGLADRIAEGRMRRRP